MNTRKLLLEGDINKYLTDSRFKKFSLECLRFFPEYFWTAPASGTGKWHQEEDNIEGGLCDHTRRVIRLSSHLGELFGLNYNERDVVVTSALLHDSWAKGLNSKTRATSTDIYHPLYVATKFPYLGIGDRFIDEREYDEVMLCVVSHSARYSVSKVLNVDKKLPRLLQIADYLGSRKDIRVDI